MDRYIYAVRTYIELTGSSLFLSGLRFSHFAETVPKADRLPTLRLQVSHLHWRHWSAWRVGPWSRALPFPVTVVWGDQGWSVNEDMRHEDMKRATMMYDDLFGPRKSFNCNANPCKVLEVENALKSGCKDRICTFLSLKMQIETPFWIHLDTTWTWLKNRLKIL